MTTIEKPNIIIKGGDTPIYGINKYINPANDNKFSPNLHGFLSHRRNKYLTNVFQDPKNGYYYIGLRDARGAWCGAKLFGVFCTGGRTKTFSYSISITKTWTDVTEWFWNLYFEVGKKIYDLPEWKEIKN